MLYNSLKDSLPSGGIGRVRFRYFVSLVHADFEMVNAIRQDEVQVSRKELLRGRHFNSILRGSVGQYEVAIINDDAGPKLV